MTIPFRIAVLVLPLLLFQARAITAQAAAPLRYSAQQAGDVVQLADRDTDTVVSIVPSVGNIAFEMKVKGQNVLHWPFESVEAFKARPSMSGIPFVGPWANRLDEQAFYANGKRYAFDPTLGNVRGGAIPIHGFLTTTDQWRLVEARADGTSAWVTSRLDFTRQPDWMKQWPFAHRIDMTYRLSNGVLEVATAITNLGEEPMPVAIGFHPYFRLTDSPRHEWTLSLAAATRWVLGNNKIPTGATEPVEVLLPNPMAAPLDGLNLDDVFSDLRRDADGRATVSVKGRTQQIDVVLGPNYRSVVIWAPHPENRGRGSQALSTQAPAVQPAPAPDRSFVCIEPMAGITSGINLAHRGLYREAQYVPGGGTWTESFWVRPRGF